MGSVKVGCNSKIVITLRFALDKDVSNTASLLLGDIPMPAAGDNSAYQFQCASLLELKLH
jgi:hypothetical protein